MQRVMTRGINPPTEFPVVAERKGRRSVSKESVVIVGAGLGGLSAAIHLRLAGFEVTVYEANTNIGGRANLIEQDGFRFDTGPSLLNYPWVFRQLFEAAGKNFEDYVELIPVEPSVAFQWEDGTHFQLSSNFTNLADECERLEPGARIRLLSFFQDAGKKYDLSFQKLVNRNEDNPLKWIGRLTLKEMTKLSVWRSLDSELKRFFKSKYIREAFGAYGMYLGGSPFDLPGLFTILAYGELAYGLWLPKGGIYGLVEAIGRLATEIGVKILTGQPIAKIIVEGNEVKGVELKDGTRDYASLIVSNVDVPTTNKVLLSRDKKKVVKTPRMTPGVITYYWGIKGKVNNIGHHTIFLPSDYQGAFNDLFKNKKVPDQLPFYISVPSETDTQLAPAGDTAMFVLVPTPVLSEVPNINWPDLVKKTKAKVLNRMRQHGVEISQEQIVFETILTPRDWQDRFGLFDGSAFGSAHTLFQVGPFRTRNYNSDIRGLYYTGASTTPGTGMPMVLLSGKQTAERIIEHLRVQ